MVKKYLQFIKEADEVETPNEVDVPKSETDESTSAEFTEIREELRSMIEKTAEKQKKDYSSFVTEFLKNPNEVKIDGLINDSDIFEFFKKWQNDIDEILNKIKFFDERPGQMTESSKRAKGVYNYMIVATEKAIIEAIKMK